MASMKRRKFLKGAALAAPALGPSSVLGRGRKLKLALGYDNFAVRAMGWKAPALIDYAAKLKCDTLFITDFGPFEKMDDGYLGDLRKKADDVGVKILLGSWSICPSSVSFNDKLGTADEHLQLGIRAAKALGSPAFRVIQGNSRDRNTEGGIAARIADTVNVLKRNRTRCLDAGIKIAVENHSGDMHTLELRGLIEDAGPDFVGANFDSGNAVWTMEDPVQALENIGKYVLTTSLRDSAVWESDNGISVQWTAMGEGTTDLKTFFKRFAELCPDVAVNIETISGFNKELKVKDNNFWKTWPNGKPKGYDKFLALAKSGKHRDTWKAPKGIDRKKAQRDYQRGDIERSLAYCKKELGLGRR
ncbi:MAG: sugar phosphate isomerase/epimerase [Roseibacillus sp.]